MAQTKTVIELPNFISVRELAERMEVSPINVIKELMSNGIMASINQEVDFDTASIVAEEMGFEAVEEVDPEVAAAAEERLANQPAWRRVLAEEREKDLDARPPVVTMLGHVDHGKTSLLDIIRQSNIQEGEAGGITQHIGAYQAEREGKLITFLDTPGHQAFTAMRARGAQATDIAILVVAADDGLMPQTREAIDHAKAADVAIIVALNKIDLATANPSLAKQQLSEVGLVPDEWDGDTLVIEVSAKENLGIEDLLEAILLVAEDLNPRANASASPTGTVIEAKMARGQGVMTTILVQNGTLKVGDTLLVGEHYGRIRAMYDFKGNKVKVALPSTPVSVSGLNGIPKAGDQFKTAKSEKEARKLVAKDQANARGRGSGVVQNKEAITLDDFFSQLQEGNSKTLSLVVKADVQGSLEPILTSLEKIGESFEEVNIEILLSGTGNVSENDVMLAAASQAVILCFNVSVDSAARTAASSEQIQINNYSIIYKMFEDVEKALKGMLDPVYEDVITGRAEIRQVFRIRQIGQIAGCYMRTGKVERSSSARLVRDGKLVYSGKISSLKHLQDSVREVRAGFEFGVNIRNWDDYKQGDILEFFVLERVEQ